MTLVALAIRALSAAFGTVRVPVVADRVAALVEYGARCYHHTRIAPVLGGVSKCYDWQPSTFSLLLHLVMVMRNLASPHSEQDTSALSDYLSAKAQV